MQIEQLMKCGGENHLFPFLWVHGEDEATYRKMINVIHDANIGAFCVEARPHDGFCGEEWWHDMDIILDEAEKLGLKVWILDDKHFPTGYAAGKALKAPLKQRRQGLFRKTFPAKGSIKLDLAENCHPSELRQHPMYQFTDSYCNHNVPECQFDDDRVLSATAVRTDCSGYMPMDLSPYICDGILQWTAPEGTWEIQLCCLSRNIGAHRSYINMMDKDSCRILLEAVYEPHYDHYKDKFGTVIAGFFLGRTGTGQQLHL